MAFHAGHGLSGAQFAVWLMSWIARLGLVKNWAVCAAPLRTLSQRLEIVGSRNSAMHVELTGFDAGHRPRRLTWYLLAGSGDGPYIPCYAAVVLARKLATGAISARGALPCMGLLNLDELLAAMAHLDIRTMTR